MGPWYGGPIQESFTGAWQRNIVAEPVSNLMSFSAVYASVTGISSDVAKNRAILSRNIEGIWEEITEPHGNSNESAWIDLLDQPNRFQDNIKFFECWIISKLLYGNTYVLKERDSNRVVRRLYILHPNCVKPLVAEDGSVYYEIDKDYLSGVDDRIVVPASEVIHDRISPLFHPLVGIPPLYACGSSAVLGATIAANAQKFFSNRSMPGGMLTAPGVITQATADRLKAAFESNFSGDNIGKLFVAGDNLEFKAFGIDAQKAQQVEQMEASVQDVARAFRYPLWKLGGPTPPYTKPDQAQTAYYVDCLQAHIESIEKCMEKGLELPSGVHVEFDLEALMRMDTTALFESNKAGDGWMKPDEQRYRANLKKLSKGGDTVYKQHQDYPIEVIADRKDISTTPAATPATPAPAPEPNRTAEPSKEERDMQRDALIHRLRKIAIPA